MLFFHCQMGYDDGQARYEGLVDSHNSSGTSSTFSRVVVGRNCSGLGEAGCRGWSGAGPGEVGVDSGAARALSTYVCMIAQRLYPLERYLMG